jgi:flagellar motility protein MotE (MotC chaperone)
MRRAPIAIVTGIALTSIGVGAWRTGIAATERSTTGAAPSAPAAVPKELFEKSRGFRELLEAVERRGEELERREQAVAGREAALKALEVALGEQLARLEAAPSCGGRAVAVTKIYASMRPEEAASIVERLDDATVRLILGGMNERQIGAILAAMTKERAVALTKLLAAGS